MTCAQPLRPIRPRDAASLVILRGRGPACQVLLGKRAPRHSFVPNFYVFPGGRVDATDRTMPAASELREPVARRLQRRWSPAMSRALAAAALRETFEETGLAFGELAGGALRPHLGAVDYLARAITPPASPIRFHARFFVAHAEDAAGAVRSNGELLDLRWVGLADALALPLVDVTEFVIQEIARRAEGWVPPGTPLFGYRGGKPWIRYQAD
jgi:8-oxo-dGTP pyrophosphatase MutT (NUDIX family)